MIKTLIKKVNLRGLSKTVVVMFKHTVAPKKMGNLQSKWYTFHWARDMEGKRVHLTALQIVEAEQIVDRLRRNGE